MTIYIDHQFHYETENLVRLFFPNDKITVVKEEPAVKELPFVTVFIKNKEKNIEISVKAETCTCTEGDIKLIENGGRLTEKDIEREMAVCLYGVLVKLTGKTQPWGILTGVRPIKLFRRLAEENGTDYACDYFSKKLLVSSEKVRLSAMTEGYEKKILSLSRPDSFSLYISIPFCPTRCSYCSFVSQSIESAKKLIEPYFEKLLEEIEYTAGLVKDCGLHLESVYIGGGTPTSLNALQLNTLIKTVNSSFDMSGCREFTVEAGRPDTIDSEKLGAILDGGADRISINPQTMNDSVLEVIGRKHNSSYTCNETFVKADYAGNIREHGKGVACRTDAALL